MTIVTTLQEKIGREETDLTLRFPSDVQAISAVMSQLRAAIGEGEPALATALVRPLLLVKINAPDPALTQALCTFRMECIGLCNSGKPRVRPVPVSSHPATPSENVVGADTLSAHSESSTQTPPISDVIGEVGVSPAAFALASAMGEHALAEVFVASGKIDRTEIPKITKIIGKHLGESRKNKGSAPPKEGAILGCGELLKEATVHEVVNHHMRKAVYRHLLSLGADNMDTYKKVTDEASDLAEKYIRTIAGEAGVTIDQSVEDYVQEIKTFFALAAGMKLPDHIVKDKTHTTHGTETITSPVPSWRQRMALASISKTRHAFIGFEPGQGKTFVPIALHEQKKAKHREGEPMTRTLYIAPKMVMDSLPQRLKIEGNNPTGEKPYYLNPKDAPNVGKITSGLTLAKILEAIEKEFVFCSYEMLHVTPKGSDKKVFQLLRDAGNGNQHWTQAVFDESQSLQGGGTRTDSARAIIHGSKDLFDKGNVLLMSGTPGSGHLAGVGVQLALLEKQHATMDDNGGIEKGGKKTLSPSELRLAIIRWMCRYDELEKWQEFVQTVEYDVSEKELAFIRLIAEDQTLDSSQKLQMMLLFIRCPELVSGDDTMKSTLMDKVEAQLIEDLKSKQTILIAEHMRSQAVLRGLDSDNDAIFSDEDNFFYKRIEKILEKWQKDNPSKQYKLHVIEGETSKKDKDAAYADLQKAKNDPTGNFKCVILAHSGCINLGIDLRSVQSILSLEWPWNSPELYQLLKRAKRAGNLDVMMRVFVANNTVEKAIVLYSKIKMYLLQLGVDGESLMTDEEFAKMVEGDGTEDPGVKELLRTPEQVRLDESYLLHNAGSQAVKKYWESQEKTYSDRLKGDLEGPESDCHRCLASLIRTLETSKIISANSCLHTNAQGFALERILAKESPGVERNFTSLEPADCMISKASLVHEMYKLPSVKPLKGTPASLVGKNGGSQKPILEPGSQSLVILEGLEQMFFKKSGNGLETGGERVESIIGAVNATKVGGHVVIPIPDEACTQKQFDAFRTVLLAFGLRILPKFTGTVKSTDNKGDVPFEMFVVTAEKVGEPDPAKLSSIVQEGLAWTHLKNPSDYGQSAIRRIENQRKHRKMPLGGLVHGSFALGTKGKQILENVSLTATKRSSQEKYLARLSEAVQCIHTLSLEAKEWFSQKKLPKNQKDPLVAFLQTALPALSGAGIDFLPHLSINNSPAFRLTGENELQDGREHPLFYPYESQWQKKKSKIASMEPPTETT